MGERFDLAEQSNRKSTKIIEGIKDSQGNILLCNVLGNLIAIIINLDNSPAQRVKDIATDGFHSKSEVFTGKDGECCADVGLSLFGENLKCTAVTLDIHPPQLKFLHLL
jgi:hypothetical protein